MSKPGRNWAPLAGRPLLALAAGVMASVVVAALCLTTFMPEQIETVGDLERVVQHEGLAYRTQISQYRFPDAILPGGVAHGGSQWSLLENGAAGFNPRSTLDEVNIPALEWLAPWLDESSPSRRHNVLDRHLWAYGWPCPCFGFVREFQFPPQPTPAIIVIEGGWEVPPHLAPRRYAASMSGPLVLPLRPLWTGLFINVSLYATLFALAMWGWRGLRLRLRRRRRQCLACGYAIGTLGTCPECGTQHLGSSVP